MIIIDSGPLLAYVNPKDPNHHLSVEIFTKSMKGNFGKLVVSNFIIDEVLTLSRARTKNCDYGKSIINFIRKKINGINLFLEINLTTEMSKLTEKKFDIFCDKGLSFTDCSLLVLMDVYKIEYLATFDIHFDGLTSIINK